MALFKMFSVLVGQLRQQAIKRGNRSIIAALMLFSETPYTFVDVEQNLFHLRCVLCPSLLDMFLMRQIKYFLICINGEMIECTENPTSTYLEGDLTYDNQPPLDREVIVNRPNSLPAYRIVESIK